jgi:hypothetical protein
VGVPVQVVNGEWALVLLPQLLEAWHTLWGGLRLLRCGRACQAAWHRRQPWQQLCRWWLRR